MKINLNNKKILITGGSGYIGSKLILKLLEHQVIIYLHTRRKNDLPNIFIKNKNVKIIHGDIADINFWKKNIKNKDFLVNLASNESKFKHKIEFIYNFKVNVQPLIYALISSYRFNKTIKIISIGSENQHGIAKYLPVSEKKTDNPVTLVGINKLIAEKYLEFFSSIYNINAVNLRLSNVYGPSVSKKNFLKVSLNKIIYDACQGKVNLYLNKNSIRDYIFIDDVVDSIFYAMKNIRNFKDAYYYIGSGKGFTIKKVAKLIINKIKLINKSKIYINNVDTKLSDFDKRNFIPDIKNFKRMTKWKPNVSLDKGIQITIDYLLDQKKL